MQQITKSVSEFLRNIKKEISYIPIEIDKMPKQSICGELSLAMISGIDKTGDNLSVSLNINLEVSVSQSVDNKKSKATEVTLSLIELIEDNYFNSSVKPPTAISAIPLGDDDRSCKWLINWDQEAYVEQFHS